MDYEMLALVVIFGSLFALVVKAPDGAVQLFLAIFWFLGIVSVVASFAIVAFNAIASTLL